MAENFLAPGVIVREKRSGVPQIRGVPTNVGAMILRTERGKANTAVRVDSFAKFNRIFGTYDPNSYGAESVDAFFKNGGSALYVVRALGSGGGGGNVKASFLMDTVSGAVATYGSVTSNVGSFPANLGLATFDGLVDNAAVPGFTIAATPALTTGAAATYAAGGAGDSISIIIAGVLGTQVIDTSACAGTQAAYLAAINAQLIGGYAADQGGQIRIYTDQKGSGAAGEITAFGGGAAAKTGLALGVFTNAGPNNVANTAAVTAAEFAALGNAGFPGSTFAPIGTDRVSWTTNTSGAAPKGVQFTLPLNIATLIPGFDLLAHNGAAATTQDAVTVTAIGEGAYANSQKAVVTREDVAIGLPTSALSAGVGPGTISQIALTSGVIGRVTVGDQLKFSDSATAQTIRCVVSQIKDGYVLFQTNATLGGAGLTVATTTVTLETWTLSILENGRTVAGPYSGLRSSSLSQKNYFVTRINTDDDENVITVTDASPAMQPNNLDVRPANTTSGGDLLAGGDAFTTFADADWIGSSGAATGFYALDKKKDVRLVAVPGVTGTVTGAVTKALLDYCTNRGDCVAILETPANTTPANAVTFKSNNVGGTSYGIMYYPWVQIVSPLSGQKASSPPAGYVMGMMARTDRERVVAKAPAGETVGQLRGTIGVERVLTDDDKATLYPVNINPIEFIEGLGTAVMGSRTMETGEFGQINIRRTFIYLEQSLKEGTRFVLFEPNDDPTRAKVRRVIASFLSTEWKLGNLEGDTASEAFYVTCDKSNNPDNTINEGKMFVSVGVNIPKTTEWLVIDIMQDQRGAEAALGV